MRRRTREIEKEKKRTTDIESIAASVQETIMKLI